ncbi:MAG: hypothetical protein KAQ94_03105 [Arcobacteraceae bacterium]|nr:hypothetical protein [Arcobacteraceae bacterium]
MKLMIILLLFVNLFASDSYHRHINKELSHLNLSKKQSRQIKKILKEFRVQLKEYRELKEEIEDKRKDIFLKEIFDTKKLNKLNLTLDTKAHDIENKLLKRIHTILNLKQRIQFIHYFDDWEVE